MGSRARHKRRETGEGGDAPDAPERTCAVTRDKLTPDELIRFVRGPDGAIVPDLASRLPGRGVWVGNSKASVAAAAKANVFARSLKEQTTVAPDLAELVEELLLRRTLQTLSLAAKAGVLLSGFTKVDVAIAKGEVIALIHASDAAEDGSGKLDRKLYAVLNEIAGDDAPSIQPRVVKDLPSSELSLAIGRYNVIHAALTKGGAAENFLREAERLRRYRSIAQSGTASPSSSGLDTDQV